MLRYTFSREKVEALSKVLVAENEPGTRKRITKALAEEDIEVESVGDGVEALRRLRNSKADLILLDIVTPRMDGWRVLETLRRIGNDIPVVLLSGKGDVSTVSEALEQGATDFISKPFDTQELIARVQRALAGQGGERRAARPRRQRRHLGVPLQELHDPETGRIDAKKVAEFLGIPLARLADTLGVSYQAVYKTPSAEGLQKRLRPIKRSLELVSDLARKRPDVLAWLNNPHPDLGGKAPMDILLRGRAGAVVTLLENAFAGIPS
jgi:CheY-like chemotaxis protein